MHFTRFIHKAFSHKLVLPHSVWGYHSEKKDKCWLTSKAPTSRSSNLPASDVPAQFTSMSTGPNFSWAWSLSNWASRKRNKELISSQSMPIDKIYKTIRPIGKICQLQAPHQTGKDQSKGEWIKSNWPNLLLVLWRSLLGYSLEIHQLIYTAPPVRKRKKWSKLCRALKWEHNFLRWQHSSNQHICLAKFSHDEQHNLPFVQYPFYVFKGNDHEKEKK